MATEDVRCAVHPSLPSVDSCPVCDRARCAADAALAPGGGCLACEGSRATRPGPPPLELRGLVGAACVSGIVAVPVGFLASQYVGAGAVGWAVPAITGIVVAIAAEAGAAKQRGPALRYVAMLYSVLAVAVGLHDPRAAGSIVGLRPLAYYVLAALGAYLWTMPPRVAPAKAP